MLEHPSRTELARFFSKISIVPSGCWVWKPAKRGCYGRLKLGGRSVGAHRVAHLWFVGPVNATEHVDHLCFNANCVNPAHLEAVSPAVNYSRGKAPRRTLAPELPKMRRPPTHPGAILNEEFLKPIGYGAQSEAARRMGISLNRLNEIIVGKRGVTAETAVLLGPLTGTDPRFWLNLQADFDLWHAMQTIDVSTIERMVAKK